MKRLVLAMALVLVMTVPVFAQNWVGPVDSEIQNDSLQVDASFGPIMMRPLMIHTIGEVSTAYFYVGQTVIIATSWEVKGTGHIRMKIETRNSAGVLIDILKKGWPDPYPVNYGVFSSWGLGLSLHPNASATPGYYTVKAIYIDVATGNTWSHETKIRVFAPY